MSNVESTVCFFKDLYKTLSAIPPKDAGILMTALFAEANGEEPDLKGSKLAEALYSMAADQMRRLEGYRKTKSEAGRKGGVNSGQTRSKSKQNEADVKQTEANAKQNEPPYPFPYPSSKKDIERKIDRNQKIQKAYGFGTERKNVNYNEIARQNYWKDGTE